MGAPSGSTNTNRDTTEVNKGSAPDPAPQAGLTSSGSPELRAPVAGNDTGNTLVLRAVTDCGGSDGLRSRRSYPNDLQPWRPPMLFQYSKVWAAYISTLVLGIRGLKWVKPVLNFEF